MPSGLPRTYGAHPLHIITCSCYRRMPFRDTREHGIVFLSILEQTRQHYRFVVMGYVVMPEHIHVLITEPETELFPLAKPCLASPCFSLTTPSVPLDRGPSNGAFLLRRLVHLRNRGRVAHPLSFS